MELPTISNKWIIIMCLAVLLISLISIYHIKDVENRCNAHWISQLKDCGCYCVNQDFPNYTANVKLTNITWIDSYGN